MSDANLVNRIPFEEIESVDVWSFPSWDDSQGVIPSVKKNQAQEGDSTESVESLENHTITPLTAEQLQKITDEAAEEASERGYQEGLQKGYAEGLEKGRQEGQTKAYEEHKAELEEKIRSFRDLTNALLDPVGMQDQALENWIVDTSMQMAKHLINRELTEDPSALFRIIESAVSSLPAGARNIRVYLHSDDVELAHEAFSGSGEQWTFHADAQLSRGGVRVVTENSLVDYSVETRLQKMLDEANFRGDVDEPPDSIPSYAPQHSSGEHREPEQIQESSDSPAEDELSERMADPGNEGPSPQEDDNDFGNQ